MKPPIYRNVRQPKGSKICSACVAAIVTGTTLEEAEAGMTQTLLPDGSWFYRTREVLKYVGGHGILMGLWFGMDGHPKPDLKLETPPIDIGSITALMVVKSPAYKYSYHWIVWTGSEVLDPSCDEPQQLTDYHILEIYPLIYLAEVDLTEEFLLKAIEKN